MPTSIEWYNPQSQLVSRDGGDGVNQLAAGAGRIAVTNKAKVDSMSAELLFRGILWKRWLFALVSLGILFL